MKLKQENVITQQTQENLSLESKTKKIWNKINPGPLLTHHYILFSIVLSVIMNFFLEILARSSLIEALKYMFQRPIIFTYNIILILLTYTFGLLCKKRKFTFILITVLWVAAGITNSVLLYFRRAPFIAEDLRTLRSAFAIMDVYMTKFQIVGLVSLVILVIGVLVFLAIKEKSKETNYKDVSMLLAITLSISILPTDYIARAKNSEVSANLTDQAYHYGYACCFLNSMFSTGIIRPHDYSFENVMNVLDKVDNYSIEKSDFRPNIIYLQLESFVDPYLIEGAVYSEDPVPNFRKLKEENSSGLLNVSVYGGATVNTEFEVLSGMPLRDFGIGEYPYETVIKKTPCETIAYNLREIGYSTHAMHNHTGTFYGRNEVYQNLGFETFTPAEYMDNLEYTSIGWEKSTVFTHYIKDAMNTTKNKDFIFAVTSQCHGKYPQYEDPSRKITVSGDKGIMNIQLDLEFYANEIHDEDKWLKSFIDEMKKYPEPVMVVMYGDHLPSINFPESILENSNIYQTEYVIWKNYDDKKIDRELSTYELSAYILEDIGIDNGITTKINQYSLNNNDELFMERKTIEYDMLYGEKFVYDILKKSPPEKLSMRLGLHDVVVDSVEIDGKNAYIKGKNFTYASIVYVDGDSVKTKFIDDKTLMIKASRCEDYEKIYVAQKASDYSILGRGVPYYNPDKK